MTANKTNIIYPDLSYEIMEAIPNASTLGTGNTGRRSENDMRSEMRSSFFSSQTILG
jgi:hypothetical protein